MVEPPRRLWLVFFSGADATAWWKPLLKPGFGHVSAAAWFDEQERWVHVDPTLRGLVIELWSAERFNERLGQLIRDSTVILRMPSCYARNAMPLTGWWCVGTVKALLGVRCPAVTPHGLYRDLMRRGAAIVDPPAIEGEDREGEDGQNIPAAETAGRGPGTEAAARG